MANANLMFEVGVKEAGNQLSDLERRLNQLVAKYGTMKIAVEISNLDMFVNALKSIGNGEQLKPLLDRIQTLQNRLGALGDKGQYFDMLRGNAAAAAKEVEKAEKYLVAMQKTGNTGFIASAKDSLQRAQVEATRANEMLASAMERVAKEEKNTSATSSELRTKIDAVGQSVSDLQAKLGNGIPINLDTSKFGPLTEQIQSLATETSGLINQLKTLSQVQSQPTNNEAIKTQTKDVENLAKAKDKLTESNKKAADSQASDESTNKVTNTYERYLCLLLEIENQMAAIGKIQLFGEQSGFSPTILKKAVDEFDKLKTVVDATIKGKPIAEGLAIPMTPEQLSQFVAQFSLLKTAYKDIVSEADKFNKQSERDFANAQKTVQSEIDKTISKLKALDESIKRGGASGRDMSVLSDAKSKLKGQLSILQKMTNSDYADSKIVEKRISNIRQLREDTENLRKVEEKLTSAREKLNKAKDKDDAKRLNDEIKSLNEAWIKYNELTAKIKELESLRDRGIKANIDITQIDSAIARYHDLKVAMMEIINNDGRNFRGNLTSQVWGDHNTKKSMQDAVADAKAYTQSLNDVEKRMQRAATVAESLGKRIDSLEAKKVDFKDIDTTRLDNAVRRIKDIRDELERFSQTGKSVYGVNADEIVRKMGLAAAIKDVNTQLRESSIEAGKAAASNSHLSASEQQLANSIKHSTDSMRSQSQVLSDLKTLATQYLGVWGAQGFLRNVIEIGGQLEMQRLSIGTILGDMAKASELFDRIKNLAIKSPFGVVELDQMTKQLSAYGFEYPELFDMTKRLADISAATGTGVDRLALALGHVRSEAALSGYTLRQFSMGNVPLLAKLSEKLGKSTEEIRKMVRAKQISYDDVVGVLKDLTDEGGMFHNMQEVISQSVKAKFKNVKDAMDIMYGEMAEGDIGDALKEVADVLMKVTQNWKDAATVLGTGTAMWALHRVAVLANIATLGEHNAATLKSIAAFRAQEAQQLRTASMYRVLSSAEKSQIATSKLLTVQERLRLALHIPLTSAQKLRIQYARQQMVMDQALAISEKKLTTEAIARQVATGKLTKAEAVQIITLADLTAAERIAALEAVNGTRKMNFFTMGLVNAGNAAMRLGTALKSIIFNPATLMMAGVTALVELWQKNNQEMERASELADTIRERSNAAMMSNKRIIEGSQMEFRDSEGNKVSPSHLDFQSIAHIQATMSIQFDKHDAQRQIDEWADYIRQYSATPNSIINEALFDGDKLRPIEEQYNRIAAAVGEIVKAQYGLHDLGDIFENATRATDSGWFNDDVITNINEYEEAVKDYNRAFAELYKDHGAGVDKIVKAVEKQNSAFAESVSGMNTYAEKFRHLAENWDKYTGAYDIARNEVQYSDNKLYSQLYDLRFGFAEGQEMNHSKQVMNEDLDIFFNHIEAEINNRGQKIGELTKAQQQDLLLGFTDFLGKTKVTTKETLDYLKKRFAERFMLTLDVDDEKFRVKVNEVTRMLQELSQSDWNVEMEFGSNVKDVIDEARKQYKAAKEYFEKVKPIMLKLGVEFEMGTELTEEQIEAAVAKADPQAQEFVRNALKGVNEATKIYNNTMAASKAGGFTLEEEKKKKTTGGTKAYQDEFAKRWDERIRIMKEAYGWYEKWEKKVGNDSAIAETNSKYGDIFREWKTDKVLPMDFDVTQIADYQRYVEKIRDDALARYQQQKNDKTKKNGEEALRVYRQAVALLNDIKFDNFVLAADQFKSTIDKTIDNLNTRWEMFNSVRTATGDEELAFTLSGLGLDENARNSAEAMKNELSKQLSDIGGQSLLDQVLFSADYDEERVRKMFKNLIPDDSKAKIDGLVQAYVEWQKLQKQVLKADVNTFANLIGSAVDLQSQVVKINEEYKQIIETLDRLKNEGQINDVQYTRGVQIASANREMKLVEASASYKLLVDGVVTMNKKAAQQVKQDFVNAVTAQLRAGAITAKEYADKIADINKKMKKLENAPSDTRAYMQGGLNGLFQNMMQKGKSQYEEGAQMYQDAQKILDTSSDQQQIAQAFKDSDAAQSMMQMGEGMEAMGEGGMECVAIIDMIVHGIDNLVQGFNDAFQQIREMYTALGYDTESDSWEDANTFFSSFSSASSSAAKGWDSLKNGDAGGVISGVVGSFTGWITGFAKGHDKKRQNHIEALQRNVAALEANTEVIKSLRGRTLGYDIGALRRYFAKTYKGGDAASNAMREFYTTGSGASGYAQELAALEKERQDYVNMYNEEDDKKDSSDEALLEFKKKIAELDEQIHYFSEDLAKELWGIDFKSWASQISDALWTAFENGEDAIDAFHDAAKDIISDVAKRMMNIHLIEPVFQQLEERLFGKMENGKRVGGAAYNYDTGQFNENETLKIFGEFFGENGEFAKVIDSAEKFYNMAKTATRFDFGEDSTGSRSSSAISKAITEEQSNLLIALANTIRADVSVNRTMIAQYFPMFHAAITSGNASLVNIENHTAAIMRSNETIANGITEMQSDIRGLKNKAWRVPVS